MPVISKKKNILCYIQNVATKCNEVVGKCNCRNLIIRTWNEVKFIIWKYMEVFVSLVIDKQLMSLSRTAV